MNDIRFPLLPRQSGGRPWRALSCLILCSTVQLAAQAPADTHAAASSKWFLVGGETASGGAATSLTYRLEASTGSGVVARAATSSTYRLAGGYFGITEVPVTGAPRLAGVLPRFVTPRGGARITLAGTELDLGGAPVIEVDGRAASLVGTPQPGELRADLPQLGAPGWRPLRVTTPQGSSVLPRGIGVLPMLFCEPAPASGRASGIVFKGSQGDQILWVVGAAPTAAPIALGGFGFGLRVDPSLYLVMPGFAVAAADGEFRLPLPAAKYRIPLYLQALFVSNNPGYGPASFSNLLTIYP